MSLLERAALAAGPRPPWVAEETWHEMVAAGAVAIADVQCSENNGTPEEYAAAALRAALPLIFVPPEPGFRAERWLARRPWVAAGIRRRVSEEIAQALDAAGDVAKAAHYKAALRKAARIARGLAEPDVS